jgi:hypothetical protein
VIVVDAIHAPIVDDSARAVLNGSDIRPAPRCPICSRRRPRLSRIIHGH